MHTGKWRELNVCKYVHIAGHGILEDCFLHYNLLKGLQFFQGVSRRQNKLPARMWDRRSAYSILVWKPEGKEATLRS
jgi:hypothetical protein